MIKQLAFVAMVLLMLFVFANATYWSTTGIRPALVDVAVDFGYRDSAASMFKYLVMPAEGKDLGSRSVLEVTKHRKLGQPY